MPVPPAPYEANSVAPVPYDKTHGGIPGRHTKEEEAFLKVFCKRPRDHAAFNEAFAEAVAEVGLPLLTECARLAVESQRAKDGDTQKLRRPETWLQDRGWEDFKGQAENAVTLAEDPEELERKLREKFRRGETIY